MKNSILSAVAVLLLSPFVSGQNGQDPSIPNRPVSGNISTVRANFGDESIGQTNDFDLKPFNKLSQTHILLKFDLAYTYFPGRYDPLAIMVSTNCGHSWETIFYSGGEELSTATPTTEYFSPTHSEWQSYQFDLYKFTGTILVRFRFINGNGNNLFLDELGFQDELAANIITYSK